MQYSNHFLVFLWLHVWIQWSRFDVVYTDQVYLDIKCNQTINSFENELQSDESGYYFSVRGTWHFDLDPGRESSNGEFWYERICTCQDGSVITGQHKRIYNDGTIDAIASEIVFDTDGTGIVGNTYLTLTNTNKYVTWTVVSIGQSVHDGNYQLTIYIHNGTDISINSDISSSDVSDTLTNAFIGCYVYYIINNLSNNSISSINVSKNGLLDNEYVLKIENENENELNYVYYQYLYVLSNYSRIFCEIDNNTICQMIDVNIIDEDSDSVDSEDKSNDWNNSESYIAWQIWGIIAIIIIVVLLFILFLLYYNYNKIVIQNEKNNSENNDCELEPMDITREISLMKNKEKDKQHCIICTQNHVSTVIIPCGHQCYCNNCWNQIQLNYSNASNDNNKQQYNQCPICRAKNVQVYKTYHAGIV